MIDCIHANPGERPSTVTCSLGLHGGRPHAGLCGRCATRQPVVPEEKGAFATAFAAQPARPPRAVSVRRAVVAGFREPFVAAPISYARRRNGAAIGGLSPIIRTAQTKLLLKNSQSPGDVLMLTAAVRDLHRAHPDRFITAVQTPCPGLWDNNPNVTRIEDLRTPDRVIECNYPLIHQSNQRPLHFIHGFAQDLENQLGVRIPVTEFCGDVHLSAEERSLPSPAAEEGHIGRYWVLMAGGKFDFTAKWWSPDFYQAVVDHFRGKIQFIQCGETGHWHPPLRNVLNLVGKTGDVRRFLRLIYHADGVLCPVTFAMHLAAAIERRPGQLARACVVVAGGREPTQWEMYPGHQFLHTQGALECCATGGCWKSRCQPVNDGDGKDSDLCMKPVEINSNLKIPKCMHLISPERVIAAIELYYAGGALPPYQAEITSPTAECVPQQAPDALTPRTNHRSNGDSAARASQDRTKIFETPAPRIGLVVATFAAVPYIHLHLETWRRFYQHIPLLVNDDGSPHAGELAELCAKYGAGFQTNSQRMRQSVGDMSAYSKGFPWAEANGLDLLVKMSRRFIPCWNWVPELQSLAYISQMPTFSQTCDHFHYGFRTECIAFHCRSWKASGGVDKIRGHVERNEPVFVEGFIHQLARDVASNHACESGKKYMIQNPRTPDRDGYAIWKIMPDRRTTRSPKVLWHNCDASIDYCRAAVLCELPYTVEAFADANQGFGPGSP